MGGAQDHRNPLTPRPHLVERERRVRSRDVGLLLRSDVRREDPAEDEQPASGDARREGLRHLDEGARLDVGHDDRESRADRLDRPGARLDPVGEGVAYGVLPRHLHGVGIHVDRHGAVRAQGERDERQDAAARAHVEHDLIGEGAPVVDEGLGDERGRLVKARSEGTPGSSSITRSPRRGRYGRHGGRTTTPLQMRNGSKCFFHSSRHASPTTSSRRGDQPSGSSVIAPMAAA